MKQHRSISKATGRVWAAWLLGVVSASFAACATAETAVQQDAPASESVVTKQVQSDLYPIDLPTALRLANAQNYKIALAAERILQASARLDQSKVLLLPTLTVGASYHRHDGRIQETDGNILDIDRTSGFAGLGAGAVGAGGLQIPGVALAADLGAAIFEPLAARQFTRAMEAGGRARTNEALLEVTIAYYELVRAKANLAIAEDAYGNASDLAEVTRRFSETGEGLESDAERAVVDQLVREGALEAARAALLIQSAQLAELLRLDAQIQLDPLEKNVAPVEVVPDSESLGDLIDTAARNHPEAEQTEALVKSAQQRLRQAKYGPLVPSVVLTFSAGSFTGGPSSSLGESGGRNDYGAMVYWQLDNLGFGDRARTRERHSVYRQAELGRLIAMDRIASSVVQAYAQVAARKKQISIGAAAGERALRSFELNRVRIYELQGLPIEALQSVESLALTRKLYLDAVIDYNQAQFRLYTALGQPPSEASIPD